MRSGRYASGARISTSRAVRRSSRPSSSRSPTATATSATEIVAISSSASEDRNAVRRLRIAAWRYWSVIRRMVCAWALARPNTLRVGSPATTSRKWWASRASRSNWRAWRAWAVQPISVMKTGISGRVTAIVAVASGSAPASRATTMAGTTAASTSWGR